MWKVELMSTFILVDTMNLGFRVRYGMRAPDMETTIGLAIHTMLNSVKKVWNQFDADHLIFALEGRSWRKDHLKSYKAHRKEAAAQRTQEEIDDDRMFFEAFDDFSQFLMNRTNATVLRHKEAEADDMIARWIALHPDDQHIIVSTDSDFMQLISANVKIYNGIAGILYTDTGVWDKDGQAAINSKGQPIGVPNPEWLLFEKIMRGDAGDNIMSAYPGVRKKRLEEAFVNRHEQGYAWNNLMLSKWTDHLGNDVKVKDRYDENKLLIDLSCQPEDLKQTFDQAIVDCIHHEIHGQVGFNLLKFANKWGLVRIADNAQDYTRLLSSKYEGALLNRE